MSDAAALEARMLAGPGYTAQEHYQRSLERMVRLIAEFYASHGVERSYARWHAREAIRSWRWARRRVIA